MRIAYLQNTPTTRTGPGAPVHVTEIAHGLLARGHVLYSILADESDRFVKLSPRELRARGREIDAYYVRIHGTKSNDRFTLLRLGNARAPCVWEVNAPLDERRLDGVRGFRLWRHKRRRLRLARLVDGAICVSDEMRDYARTELGIARTIVVPNGSDPERFAPARHEAVARDPSPLVAVWAGSSRHPWQGLRIVERLADRLLARDAPIRFLVTAPGDSRLNLRYVGELPHAAMPALLASAHVGLCVYEHITFYPRFYFSPLKLYDFMASGLAVLGTAEGQVGQVIESEHCGLTSDCSLEDLEAKLLRLAGDRALCASLGARGRAAVIARYNWQRAALDIEGFLVELCERSSSGRA